MDAGHHIVVRQPVVERQRHGKDLHAGGTAWLSARRGSLRCLCWAGRGGARGGADRLHSSSTRREARTVMGRYGALLNDNTCGARQRCLTLRKSQPCLAVRARGSCEDRGQGQGQGRQRAEAGRAI